MNLDNRLSLADSRQSAPVAVDDIQRVPVESKFLARGAAADVWLAPSADIHGRKYVIKIFRVDLRTLQDHRNPRGPRAAEELWSDFIQTLRLKVEIWEALRHDNIVDFFGIHEEPDLRVEFCANGTASQYLEKHSDDHIKLRKRMILDLLAGIVYLHSQKPPVIHGCICMDKLLVDSQGRTKISEFGLASLVEGFGLFAPSISQSNRTRWLSPELLDTDADEQPPICTTESDIWALGCTLFEIMSGKLPYFKLKHDLRVQKEILSKKPPGRQDSCLAPEFVPFWPLLTQCWSWAPEQRPVADSLDNSIMLQHTKHIPSEQVRKSASFIQKHPLTSPATSIHEALNSTVTSSMSCQEIVSLLTDHSCYDFTEFLDEPACSKFPVASGGLGDVFFGYLIDKTPLAIKTIGSYHEPGQSARVYHERVARDIYTWSKCKHPNVLPLMGFAVFRNCLAMVSHWEENGSLLQYLSRNPSADRCNMSTSICAGLAYLHEHDIVHGDLKGANVLISQDGTPMLMDFGNASLLEATLQFTEMTTGPYISPQWTAPEILRGASSYTKSGDIYSLGMTILEAFTSQIPFPNQNIPALFLHVVVHKKTPVRPETAMPINSVDGDKLWAILTRCWSYNPKDRPTAETAWNEMKEITAENLKEIPGIGDEEEGRQDNSRGDVGFLLLETLNKL